MDQFAEIRPYNDSEVAAVLERLLVDDELISAISSMRFGPWHKSFTFLIYPLVRFFLARQLKGVNSVLQFQQVIKKHMDDAIERTSTGFTMSGLDELDPAKPYLFMSNHRDIAMDPAYVSYALYQHGHDTVRIAIGDNLLTKPYVSDLMRLNKSFIVKRSIKAPRQLLAAYKLLSGYIKHSIEEDNCPIWIAQREGRAKDGFDKTEPAIIKMLTMGMNRKTDNFAEYVNNLQIVPVAISYELDPCDGAKAKELYEKASQGEYIKEEHEDVASIAAGIGGNKGNVHVSFGTPLNADFVDAEEVAQEVDRQVINNYVLHPTNFFAYKMLKGEYPEGTHSSNHQVFDEQQLKDREQQFRARIEALPEEHREYALGIYANPIISKQKS
jgi:hypothetical protein